VSDWVGHRLAALKILLSHLEWRNASRLGVYNPSHVAFGMLAAWAAVAMAQPAATNAPAAALSLRRRIANAIDKLEYVCIPAGTFTMVCSPDDAECNGEQPLH
jgi:hypothetical protein